MRRASASVASALALGVLGGVGWYLWHSNPPSDQDRPPPAATSKAAPADFPRATPAARFRCDTRTQCEQMTSCEEAMFFLQSCPKVELDQDGDGIPCEIQWCVQR